VRKRRASALVAGLAGALMMLTVAARAQGPAPNPAEAPAPNPAAASPPAAPPPPAAAPAPPSAAAKPVPPQNLETIEPSSAVAILGKKVRDAAGADMGMVVDVLVARDGTPLAAVIDFGGFLGVGSRKIAIDWQLLQFAPTDRNAPIVLALNRAEVQAAPEYKPSSQPVQVVGPPAAEGRSTPDSGK
jgi:hypothetical protein